MSVIAFVNAQRLEDARAARRVLLLSLLVTGVALAASCALVVFDGPRWADRLTTFGFALLLYLLVRRELLVAERAYEKGGNSFASLVLPGVAAVVVSALISAGIKLILLGAFPTRWRSGGDAPRASKSALVFHSRMCVRLARALRGCGAKDEFLASGETERLWQLEQLQLDDLS